MRKTNFIEKLLASIINITIVEIIFIPFVFLDVSLFVKKIIFITLFLFYNLLILIFNKNRCIGMIYLKLHWKENYHFMNRLIYNLFYTLSFSTLLFWIYIPLDLFLLNMIFLQLPTIILKKTTFHGYISGNMVTVKTLCKIQKKLKNN